MWEERVTPGSVFWNLCVLCASVAAFRRGALWEHNSTTEGTEQTDATLSGLENIFDRVTQGSLAQPSPALALGNPGLKDEMPLAFSFHAILPQLDFRWRLAVEAIDRTVSRAQ